MLDPGPVTDEASPTLRGTAANMNGCEVGAGAARLLLSRRHEVRRRKCAPIEHSLELTHEANSRPGRLRRTFSAAAVAVCLSAAIALIIAALHIREEQGARGRRARAKNSQGPAPKSTRQPQPPARARPRPHSAADAAQPRARSALERPVVGSNDTRELGREAQARLMRYRPTRHRRCRAPRARIERTPTVPDLPQSRACVATPIEAFTQRKTSAIFLSPRTHPSRTYRVASLATTSRRKASAMAASVARHRIPALPERRASSEPTPERFPTVVPTRHRPVTPASERKHLQRAVQRSGYRG